MRKNKVSEVDNCSWWLQKCVGEGVTPFSRLLHFSLDPYFIMLRIKQGGIKYRFLSLRYVTTWDFIPVSRTIGENPTQFYTG